MSQFEIIGTPAMRVFKRYEMPFSAYSLRRHSGFGASATVSRTTLSNVEGEPRWSGISAMLRWAVRN